MARRSISRRALALGAVLTLAAPAAAQARDIYATDSAGNLLRIDSRYSGTRARLHAHHRAAGRRLAGGDRHAARHGRTRRGGQQQRPLHRSMRGTAVATPIGAGFTPGLTGTAFGVDVNPVPDALRITGESNQNYRIAFATGNHGAASPDARPQPGRPLDRRERLHQLGAHGDPPGRHDALRDRLGDQPDRDPEPAERRDPGRRQGARDRRRRPDRVRHRRRGEPGLPRHDARRRERRAPVPGRRRDRPRDDPGADRHGQPRCGRRARRG